MREYDMHDLIAELTGYRNELSSAERRRDNDKAKAVRTEIKRVAGEINDRIDQLMRESDKADVELQDLTAAQKRQEARRMARELPEQHRGDRARQLTDDSVPGADNAAERTPAEDAAERTPAETATPAGRDRSAGRGRPGATPNR